MKQLIVPAAIIVALIALFVFIDRKDFSLHDDVQTFQSENPETDGKTTISVSHTMSATEVNQAVEAKPVKTKLVAEAKPETEPKPATKANHKTDTKLTEMKPIVEMKPVEEEQFAPAAIPVVTAEESEKLNTAAKEFAIAEKEKQEPFYRFYAELNLETICFEGTIKFVSNIPDPDKNDYPNCLYTLFVEIDSIFDDSSTNIEIANEILLEVPILKDKKVLRQNVFKPGDKIHCACMEYETLPQEIREIQISDDIQSFEHSQYYPLEIKKLTHFNKGGTQNFAKKEITILPIQSLPKDEKSVTLRRERINNEIARIENEIRKHGGSFEKWKEEYKPIAEKYKQLSSEHFKGWINDSYFAATGNESSYSTKDYIEGILPYKKYLEENNIDLIIVRIPSKGDFAARVLCSDVFQENPAWIEHYYECLKNDIEIIDPMPEMWKHRFDLPLFYYYNDDKETHPFEGTYFYSAYLVAEALKRYNYSKEEKVFDLKRISHNGKESKFFYPDGNSKYNPYQNVKYYQVMMDNQPVSVSSTDSGSPFVFISNSFFGRYLASYVGLPIYVSYFLQTIPDWIYQDGNTGLLQYLVSHPLLLNHRRVVIMVGHPRFWNAPAPIPKYIADHADIISFYKTLAPDQLTISSSDYYSISPTESDITIKENTSHAINIELDVPHIPNKTKCMIRVSFNQSSFSNIQLIDTTNGDILDRAETPIKAPLIVCLTADSSESKTLRIQISPMRSGDFSISNIQLWYY